MATAARRAGLIVTAVALALGAASPAAASAAQSLSITSPTGFPAGGDPDVTLTIALDGSAGTPSQLSLTLAPGVLASLGAAPACVTGTPQHTLACAIGDGTATLSGLPAPFTAYLTPASSPSAGVAGVDIVVSGLGITTHSDLKLVQTADGNVAAVQSLDLSQLGSFAGLFSGLTFNIHGKLADGHPFLRMPTNCTPAHSSLTIAYASQPETVTASPDFAPTGCTALPFSPKITGSATKDKGDDGVAVSATITQADGQAAPRATTVALPASLISPNLVNALGYLNSPTPVATATASSPLLPAPVVGHAFLTNTAVAPQLTFRFPAPLSLTLTGNVDAAHNSMTFSTLPDVPLSSLNVSFTSGPKSLFFTTCKATTGTITGSFTSHAGVSASASNQVTVTGCAQAKKPPGKPRISGGFSGVGRARPALHFSLTKGVGAAAIKSFVLSLPSGLSVDGKHLRGGLTVGRAGKFSARIAGGKLVVTLRTPASHVSVSVKNSALVLGSALAQRLRHHRVKHLSARVTVTDAAGKTTRLALRS